MELAKPEDSGDMLPKPEVTLTEIGDKQEVTLTEIGDKQEVSITEVVNNPVLAVHDIGHLPQENDNDNQVQEAKVPVPDQEDDKDVVTKQEDESPDNPWNAKSVMDFNFFCCPECEYKGKTIDVFEDHAVKNHAHAQKFFLLQREGAMDGDDIKPEPEEFFEEDEDPSYTPNVGHFLETHQNDMDYGDDDDFIDDDEYMPERKYGKRGPGRPKGSKGSRSRGSKSKRSKREIPPQVCPKCDKKGDSFNWLARHVNVEHGPNDGRYTCHMCDNTQAQFRYLERHMEKEHFNTRYPCDQCPKILGDRNSLMKHVATVHNADRERRFQCDECEFSTHALKYLKGHKFNCHMKDKHAFACDQCDKKFPYAFNLKQHKETTHLGLKNAVCDTCGKGFPTKGALRVHTKNGCKKLKPNVPVSCPTCNEEFTADLYMYHHFRSVHGGIPPNKMDKEQFICDQCPSVFFSKLALKFHFRKKHAGPVPLPTTTVQRWNCPHCEKIYNTRKAYDEHVKVKHEGYTPFRCTECPREFGTQLKLKSHFKLVHQRVKCDLCHKEIPNKFLMQQHKWTAHGIRPENAYECEQCSLLFTKEINYAKHMLKKHPGQPSLPLQQHHPSLVQQ